MKQNKLKMCASLMSLMLLSVGCSTQVLTTDRLSYQNLKRAKEFKGTPITVVWSPESFPDRIEKKGPSGFVGALTETSLPSGSAIAARVEEGLGHPGKREVRIAVQSVNTEYLYGVSFAPQWPIVESRCVLVADFELEDKRWRGTFLADREGDGSLIDEVWDEIALQVIRSVREAAK